MPWTTNPLAGNMAASLEAARSAGDSSSDMWKQFLRGFVNRGKDVSNIELFQPTLQAGQSQGRQIAEAAGYGDKALQAAGGGVNADIAKRATQIAQDRNQENTAQAVANLGNQALGTATNWSANNAANQDQFNLGQLETAGQGLAENSEWYASPWSSFLPNLLSGAAKGAMSFI